MSTLSPPPPPCFPSPTPVQTWRFLKDPFALVREARQRHGDIFTLRLLGLGEWTFLASPALVRQMFKAPADVLVAGEINRAQLGFMLGLDATFPLDGEAHRRRQRLVHPHLNGRRIHNHIATMRNVALRALESWPERVPFPFLQRAHRMSLDVMIQSLLGTSDLERVNVLADLFERFAGTGLRSPLIAMPYLQIDLGRFSPWGRILEMRRQVVDSFAAEIARRIAEHDPTAEEETSNIITALARARREDGEYELSQASLLDEVINLLFAGHETTGNVLAWVMETLHTHPEVLERLRRELDEVLGNEPIESDHLDRLPYLHAVVYETVRYRPLAPMAGVRLAKQPFEIHDPATSRAWTLPQGAIVTQCFPEMARLPSLFARPDAFDPDHFLDSATSEIAPRRFEPFQWNPFGGGTRMCIGRGLAEIQLKVIVATLLQNAELRLAQPGARPKRNGLFFSPSQGLKMELVRRGVSRTK